MNKLAKAVQGQLDLVLLADVVQSVDLFSEGRLLECGQITAKDVTNCQRLAETMANLIYSNRTHI